MRYCVPVVFVQLYATTVLKSLNNLKLLSSSYNNVPGGSLNLFLHCYIDSITLVNCAHIFDITSYLGAQVYTSTYY